MSLHGALFSIPFDLICNVTTIRRKSVLTFDPTPGVDGVCKDKKLAAMLLHASFRLI